MASAEKSSRTFRGPKGTRDFYPQDMAVRRYIEGVWRQTSINHGFDEIEGPMFEDIDLYTHKSGPGIVSEIFQVFSGKDEAEVAAVQRTARAPYALRPEFTPTLARMVAAKAAELPRPIKWFAIPQHFRAERPQRGRLREFMQWNVDFIGEDSPGADAEVIATGVAALQQLGLQPTDAKVKINSRLAIEAALDFHSIPLETRSSAYAVFDRISKVAEDRFIQELVESGIPPVAASSLNTLLRTFDYDSPELQANESWLDQSDHMGQLLHRCSQFGLDEWLQPEISIIRGLAYYTSTVFEFEAAGERAIAGGGRYDNLIESFGGPSLPACGFGMGDVVLANLLHDKNLLPEDVYMKPLRPHAFAIAASDEAEATMRQTVSQLRRDGFHIRHSYKTTRNVGKLLGEASKSRAMSAIIFGKDVAADPPQVDFKDLQSGEQKTVALSKLESHLKALLAAHD